jgi:hypothetical protein
VRCQRVSARSPCYRSGKARAGAAGKGRRGGARWGSLGVQACAASVGYSRQPWAAWRRCCGRLGAQSGHVKLAGVRARSHVRAGQRFGVNPIHPHKAADAPPCRVSRSRGVYVSTPCAAVGRMRQPLWVALGEAGHRGGARRAKRARGIRAGETSMRVRTSRSPGWPATRRRDGPGAGLPSCVRRLADDDRGAAGAIVRCGRLSLGRVRRRAADVGAAQAGTTAGPLACRSWGEC